MRILICMDSWKGSLDADQACAQVAAGLHAVLPSAEILSVPLADGGEGTLARVRESRPGELIRRRVCGPLRDRQVEADYLCWPESREALIEMASCAGLTLLSESERDPLRTTTYGVGELMRDALDRGCRQLTLAVGGSATVDAGSGMLQALGWRFLDAAGNPVPPGGGGLLRLDRILPPETPPACRLRVMCDVTNPLLGKRGAAAVFAPQKGADAEGVRILETALTRWAEVVARDLGREVSQVPGGGAAGGIAAACLAAFDAELVSGVGEVMRIAGLEEKIAASDWVVTGEGRVDEQSLQGKVLSGVLAAARKSGVPVAVIAGGCTLSDALCAEAGIAAALSANDQNLPLAEAMARAAELAEAAGRRLGCIIRSGDYATDSRQER